MHDPLKFLTKVFKTSPGNFTKRETFLIRHFLINQGNIDKSPGIDVLRNALNSSNNNIKWILKTFLIANLKTGRKSSLNSVITTINGRVYKRQKMTLRVERGKAVIEPAYARQRHPIFPDRSGMGAQNVYLAEKLKYIKIPKPKTEPKKSVKVDKPIDPKKAELMIIRNEMTTMLKALDTALVVLDPISSMVANIEVFSDIVGPNADSLSVYTSGDWYVRRCTTARRQGGKLIVKYIRKDRRDDEITVHRYEYKDVMGIKTSGKYSYKLGHECRVERDLEWVFPMFRPLSYSLIKSLERVRGKKMENVDKKHIAILVEKINFYKKRLQKFWNNRFSYEYEGQERGTELVLLGKELISLLWALQGAILGGKDLQPSITPIKAEELFEDLESWDSLTDLDIAVWMESEKKMFLGKGIHRWEKVGMVRNRKEDILKMVKARVKQND